MFKKSKSLMLSVIMISWFLPLSTMAQQLPDLSFNPPVPDPAYSTGKGPVVLLDEAHSNFHTAGGRYKTFAQFLGRDGYIVKPSSSKFSRACLSEGRILVIANALSEDMQDDISLPIPSAFSDEEIKTVHDWVKSGGSLLLIVDHLPFPGCAQKLASAFGITFHNGYAMDEKSRGPIIFRRSDGSLLDHRITKGRTDAERIDSVATFTGSAFQVKGKAEPLIVLGPSVMSVIPSEDGELTEKSLRIPVSGWLQGAVMKCGKGRVAVFGEAAMFTAQVTGPNRIPVGMNSPLASQNPRFLLNVMHWLSGR